MKLQEIKDFVKELRGLSQEELAKKENFNVTTRLHVLIWGKKRNV